MNQIFKNAYITVATARATTVNSGVLDFEESPSIWPLPICLPNGRKGAVILKYFLVTDISQNESVLALGPFKNKAYKIEWHYTIQQNDCGIIREPFWSVTKPLLALLFRSQARSSSPIPIHGLCYKWSEIVENYGLRSLTDSGISYGNWRHCCGISLCLGRRVLRRLVGKVHASAAPVVSRLYIRRTLDISQQTESLSCSKLVMGLDRRCQGFLFSCHISGKLSAVRLPWPMNLLRLVVF